MKHSLGFFLMHACDDNDNDTMSHPHKFVESVAEPILASKPSLAATKPSINKPGPSLSDSYPTDCLTHAIHVKPAQEM
ncbi:hypothetical protein FRC09_014782 [Ceratobasidium sp. 395]|nr:hypothetical protein FRC09_014782 [Ceratobasidium sp. 395]